MQGPNLFAPVRVNLFSASESGLARSREQSPHLLKTLFIIEHLPESVFTNSQCARPCIFLTRLKNFASRCASRRTFWLFKPLPNPFPFSKIHALRHEEPGPQALETRCRPIKPAELFPARGRLNGIELETANENCSAFAKATAQQPKACRAEAPSGEGWWS